MKPIVPVAAILGLLGLLAACGAGKQASTPSSSTSSIATAAPSATTATSASVIAAPSATTPPHVTKVDVPAAISAAIDAPDRSADDRALDAGRHPGETFAFFGIKQGMRVAELAAGGGYTSELLARIVGPSGHLYAENPKAVLDKFAEAPWTARLAKPVMKGVVRLDRELEAPFPDDVRDLDAVVMVLFYHDTGWLKTDRAAMNAAIFRALKPGGVYGIVDHSGREGTGISESGTIHRVEETLVISEVTSAGFKLAAEADFLRNTADSRDWNDSPKASGDKRGTSDRFVLEFVK